MNSTNLWAKDLNPEDLPEPYRTVAYKSGISSALILAEMYQGTHIYLPKLDGVLRAIRDKKIKQEFNGYNYRELALKYKLSEIWVRQIVENRNNIDQISMFDEAADK